MRAINRLFDNLRGILTVMVLSLMVLASAISNPALANEIALSSKAAVSGTTSEAQSLPYPDAPGGDLRNTLPELTKRAGNYMTSVISALGPGQCWPGIGTYRRQMARYAELEKTVEASGIDADKKKHVLTCAKIAAVTKGITGSSSISYFVTMTIGLAKEFYDKSFLNRSGGRDYLDLDADAIGAKMAYENQAIPTFDQGRTLETTSEMDVRALARYKERMAALMERHIELLSEGETEKAAELKEKEISPLAKQISLMEAN